MGLLDSRIKYTIVRIGVNIIYNIYMEELVNALKGLIGDLVALRYKAQGYHWNVEGDDFPQFHEFFGNIYEDIDGSIDPFAENIRKLGDYAPFKLSRLVELSRVPETNVTPDPESMCADLLSANEGVIARLMDAFDVANNSRQQGIANFIAERIDMHQKWSWQLRVSCKTEAPEMD